MQIIPAILINPDFVYNWGTMAAPDYCLPLNRMWPYAFCLVIVLGGARLPGFETPERSGFQPFRRKHRDNHFNAGSLLFPGTGWMMPVFKTGTVT